jgi:hypothetical protein
VTRDEVMALPPGELPVLCEDGRMGLLTVWPGSGEPCGVQVHGERDHRWMTSAELVHLAGGALAQVNAPRKPAAPKPGDDGLAQLLVAADWAKRGGQAVIDRFDGPPTKRSTFVIGNA